MDVKYHKDKLVPSMLPFTLASNTHTDGQWEPIYWRSGKSDALGQTFGGHGTGYEMYSKSKLQDQLQCSTNTCYGSR